MADDLNRPLGLDGPSPSRFDRPVAWLRFAFAGLALLALSLVAFVLVTGERNGGEPFAVAWIEQDKSLATPAVPPPPAAKPSAREEAAAFPQAGSKSSAADGERASGVKVVRPGGADSPNPLIIKVPDAAGQLHLSPAPDPRLIEKSRYGLLPRIGADGARPADVYARPALISPKLKAGAPRIAIFVGGIGVSRAATQEAIDKLPGAVTLAFAPYGSELEAQVARARDSGHEIVLQVPMEPFASGDDDPGPHTLRTDRSPEAIVDDLHWLMARFSGYVGMTNFLGARFTADETALAPVLREIKERGLFYVEDATSRRSAADAIAARADLA